MTSLVLLSRSHPSNDDKYPHRRVFFGLNVPGPCQFSSVSGWLAGHPHLTTPDDPKFIKSFKPWAFGNFQMGLHLLTRLQPSSIRGLKNSGKKEH